MHGSMHGNICTPQTNEKITFKQFFQFNTDTYECIYEPSENVI